MTKVWLKLTEDLNKYGWILLHVAINNAGWLGGGLASDRS